MHLCAAAPRLPLTALLALVASTLGVRPADVQVMTARGLATLSTQAELDRVLGEAVATVHPPGAVPVVPLFVQPAGLGAVLPCCAVM